MSVLFFKLVGMSITAGWLILAVMIARHILKKAPKGVNYILWMLVAVRLLCPFLPKSDLSLVPGGLHRVSTRQVENLILEKQGVGQELFTGIWIVGMLLLLGYSLISFIRLKLKLRTAVRLKEDVWQSEYVKTPFILGICSPKIYVPYHISEQQLTMVVAHERSHAKQKDHVIKLAAFILLAVYWFSPMVWAAYILLCRDIEIACDERVVKDMMPRERKMYSEALLSFSVSRHAIAACPVFFGEVGVKMRIKKILSYKKSSAFVRMEAAAACALLGICFLTNPKEPEAVTALSDQSQPDVLSAQADKATPQAAAGAEERVLVATGLEATSSQESNASDVKVETKKADNKEARETITSPTDEALQSDILRDDVNPSEVETGSDKNPAGSGKDETDPGKDASDSNKAEADPDKDEAGNADASLEEVEQIEPESSKDEISQVGSGSTQTDKPEMEEENAEDDAAVSDGDDPNESGEDTDGDDLNESGEDTESDDLNESGEDTESDASFGISDETPKTGNDAGESGTGNVAGPETEESSK
ncbi:MAG: M56 family metallopeptidase [Lachnospiraceae bacterium]